MKREFVYRYRDVKTNEIKYVGRAQSSYRFAKRIYDHLRDSWEKTAEWEISFTSCANRAAGEALEAELINTYNPEFNIAKKGWGLLGIDINENYFIKLPNYQLLKQAGPLSIQHAVDEVMRLLDERWSREEAYEQ